MAIQERLARWSEASKQAPQHINVVLLVNWISCLVKHFSELLVSYRLKIVRYWQFLEVAEDVLIHDISVEVESFWLS